MALLNTETLNFMLYFLLYRQTRQPNDIFAQQSCSFYFCLPEHLISFPPTDLPAVTPVNCVNKGIFVRLG